VDLIDSGEKRPVTASSFSLFPDRVVKSVAVLE